MNIMVPSIITDQLLQNQSAYRAQAGNLSMGDPVAFDVNNLPTLFTQGNLTGNLFRVTFVAANVDQTIIHDLNRVPVGYIVVRKDQTADVYDGTIAGWTTANIVLRSTVAGVDTTLYIF